MKTGIIIPCFNEEKRLNVEAFVSFIKLNDDYHLCFVNDGSKDDTLEVLSYIKEQRTIKVTILDMKRNKGKAAAIRAGARYFFHRHDVDYIGSIDADLPTNFKEFKKLVKTIDENENLSVVYDSNGNGKIERNLFRYAFCKILKTIMFYILRLPISELQCETKVFRRKVIPVVYNNEFLSKWLYDVEIFMRLKKYLGAKNTLNIKLS